MTLKVGSRFIPKGMFGQFIIIPLSLIIYDDLSPTCKLLWGLIAKHLGKDGKAYPTQTSLSRTLGITKRSLARASNQLVGKGFLEKEPGIGRRPTHYHLLFHEIFATDPHLKVASTPPHSRADTSVHSQPSRADKNVHSQAVERGQEGPLRVVKAVTQKRTLRKENKEEKKTRARELPQEQQEWLALKLAMDVFQNNLSTDHKIESRRAELILLIESGKALGPSIEALRAEKATIEREIMRIPRSTARDTLIGHLERGTLTQKNFEEWREAARTLQANAV